MLKVCGLKLMGHHHSGIDDSKNIASVVIKLMQKGYEFTQGMVIEEAFSSGSTNPKPKMEERKEYS